MSADDRATIEVQPRAERGSRESRRMRKEGRLPGILYGRGRDPQAFSVNERELRAALKAGHALLDVQLDGDTVPVIVKDQQHHPVRGGFTHVDLLEVDLKATIQSTVPVELTGVDDAPGVIQGGVLDHVTRELNIEALPTDIPDAVTIDVSSLELNGTFLLSEATIPSVLTVLDDPEETVIATLTPPTKVEAPAEVEEETEVVGEAAEAEAEGEGGDEGEGGE
ncbi:MAG: 50S ribosomal protein L25 [Actinobacteria bacterium]|nr:50S ribosomal protein L25 [Actinomycetota bacterium]